MKKGNSHPKKPFAKGDPRINRKGRAKLPPEVKALRELTTNEFVTRVTKYMLMTQSQLKDLLVEKGNQIDMLDTCILKALQGCVSKGDYGTLDRILDRIIGRVTQPISGPAGGPIETKNENTHAVPETALAALGNAIVAAEASIRK